MKAMSKQRIALLSAFAACVFLVGGYLASNRELLIVQKLMSHFLAFPGQV
jgi:hypothetical protein